MNIKSNIKIENEYFLKRINTITNETLDDLKFHNTVLKDNFLKSIKINGSFYYYNTNNSHRIPNRIAIGSGKGIPQSTDTSLFNKIKSFESTYTVNFDEKTNIIKYTSTYTIPATEGEVYDITEIGIELQNGNSTSNTATSENTILVTHAMITDSEGNYMPVSKSSTDKVILTCIMYVTITAPELEDFTVDNIANFFQQNGTLGFPMSYCITCSPQAEKQATRYHSGSTTSKIFGTRAKVGIGTSSTFLTNFLTNGVKDYVNKQIVYNLTPSRFLEYPITAYIKGVGIPRVGYVSLPNENIFPAFQLKNIKFEERGNGAKTEFKCPLNYFKKGTEKIYINDILQDKSTYTIDNEANQDELVELSAGNDAIITGGQTNGNEYAPLFRRAISNTYNDGSSYGSPGITTFYSTVPLFLSFNSSKKINTLRVPFNTPNNIVFTLYGSASEEDEKDWIQLTSFKTPTRYGKFDTVEYKYFKIEATSPPTPYSVSGSTTIPSPYDLSLNTLDKCKQHLWFLGYIGEGVKFTTPPPAGATITIDADTDLPMLGPELVMDVTTTVTFQF